MASSGTINFNLSVEELIEKSFDLVGGELTSGEDLKQARRSLDLLFIDLQNRGCPLGKLQQFTVPLVQGTTTYTLPTTVVDVLDMVLTRDGIDTPMERLSLFEYHRLPVKTDQGRPSQWATDRTETTVKLYLFLCPENSTDVVDFWAISRVEDAGAYTNTVDFSYRYLPALVFGLAYFLSLAKAGFPQDRRLEIRQNYQELLEAVMEDDRERVSFNITPPGYFN